MRLHMDRFLAALVVYARRYLNTSTGDTNAESIVYEYAERNHQPLTFNPKVVAFYASQLNHENESELFARFLKGFDGDKDERLLLVQMGFQYNLDMGSILRRTYDIVISNENTMEHHMECDNDGAFILDGTTPHYILNFLQALEWLLMDASLYEMAIQEVNAMIRKVLAARQVYLADTLVNAIPVEVLNNDILQAQDGSTLPYCLEELQGHILLIECWTLYSSWESSQEARPMVTEDKLETLKCTLAWKDKMMELTEKLEKRLQRLLTSSWLKGK
ncbi:nuclear pore protein 84/107 [Halteromyces radiatus]|uniref:nuclear pore protein 84/107 n=1 Tax=Halteromyces radiatus TaxID=101107 RepID=UPI0022208D36|nr:nuclear pore protein 84/107 [Halteromyces radiatus]KAI8100039.1 nuclear pore protein 84/107 [Halteromyces radiatus]